MRSNTIVALFAAFALIGIGAVAGSIADTAILPGNHPREAETLTSLGNAQPSQVLSMEVRFAVRNEKELDQLLAQQQNPASPNYHRWLSPQEYGQRFGPRPSDIDAVADWLKGEGFAVESTSGGYIRFSGTVAQAQRSFATRIARFGDGSTYANVDDPTIPARFAGVIGSLLGLDNMTHAMPLAPSLAPKKVQPPASSAPGKAPQSRSSGPYAPQALVNGVGIGFAPGDIRTFYNDTVASGRDGSGGCIAIVGVSDYLDGALTAFQNQFMSSEQAFNVTRVPHGSNPGRTGDNNEIEAEIDLEWSHAVAPGAAHKYHFGNNLIDAISGAIDDTCDIISISFTFCGPGSGYAGAVDKLMKKAAASGQTVFVSSGDAGAAGNPGSNCAEGNQRNVSEMAADPNVTAVGGTQFTPSYDINFNDIGYSNNERVWNGNGASGGGASKVYGKPTYQKGPGVPGDGKRDVPDVALIAGSPGVFWGRDFGGSGGIACCIGGTSVAAPIWAGFARALSQVLGARLGPMNPLIYQLANQQFGSQSAASGFHDITIGDNSFNGVNGFNAAAGYDQATGWGTVDFDVFAAAAQAQPTPTPGPLKFPKKVSFGSRKVGTPPAAPKTINLSNPAKNKLATRITADATLMKGADFTITSSACTSGVTVPAGKNCAVTVVFNPQSAGKTPLTDVLIFSDNASNSQQQVPLSGIGK